MNASETLNIRGERSVTCQGRVRPPAVRSGRCRKRHRPSANLPPAARCARTGGRARRQYGSNPDLKTLPMYCVVPRSRIPSIRRTCARPRATTPTSQWTCRRATMCGTVAQQGRDHLREDRAARVQRRPRRSGRKSKSRRRMPQGGVQMSAWSGQPCNPYDTRACSARLERRVRRRGQREPRHCAISASDPAPHVGALEQRRSADPPEQGDAGFDGGAIGAHLF